MSEKSDCIEIKALGRKLVIGALYNRTSDTVIPGKIYHQHQTSYNKKHYSYALNFVERTYAGKFD